ncbi:UDP-N-acetylmuramate--alanine ligase [Serinicoccus hydrothermalis]|uniref:UDP-N-acetylmuramate--L-alanine ligase n=1 Tax=Serinicoccus hydrothermalis TaxID=1758689 RepID=A0A1B1NA06_9MICO|nr:UDP-N-acetylmuramate--L-alanine ligase [Serinicoccus hydrothermalis]ANS78273.1 UDP-N-acetylmuramate--alanine ligase [Serinicoccus hydrothermalis]
MSRDRFDFSAPVPPVEELGAVHFIALGGSGVSGVARMFLDHGVTVSGSDQQDSPTLRSLEQAGAQVHVGHDAAHLGGAGTVVVSGAVREDNPELAAARAAGLRVLHRSQGIAALLHGRPAVAVAGANGKTTTSAMTTAALQAAGVDPGYVIGAPLASNGRSAELGAPGAPLVVEADESDGSFLTYRPQVAVVTNVQPDHLDFYGDVAAVEAAYRDFVATIADGGLLITSLDDPGAARLAQDAAAGGTRVVTWGAHGADVQLDEVVSDGLTSAGTLTFRTAAGPVAPGTTLRLRLPVPGEHSVHDAVAALLVATAGLGLPLDRAVAGLESFAGAHRRFERVGSLGPVEVVDDYAHNAPKVAAAVRAARSAAGGRRLVVAFQPHLFSRTRDFADGFAEGLAGADVVLLLPVYPARERAEDFPGITSDLLGDRLVARDGDVPAVHTAGSVDEAAPALRDLVAEGQDTLVVTIGAGDVTRVGRELLTLLQDDADAGTQAHVGAGSPGVVP